MATSTASRRSGQILAVVRIVMGTLGLLAPQVLLRRLATDEQASRAGMYPFRMFGIRTILLGIELLTADDASRRKLARLAILIHASDTVSAVVSGMRGDLPRRAAVTTALISSANTTLAVLATRD
ncbi:hypothetical protein ACPPVS_08290 [Cellulomonas sp. McL0617]|uniref:hypothetical protein n=1 Tax=Cellulomonas sp. McL0617 TaxID=3415675 RepID=UPI003CF9667A